MQEGECAEQYDNGQRGAEGRQRGVVQRVVYLRPGLLGLSHGRVKYNLRRLDVHLRALGCFRFIQMVEKDHESLGYASREERYISIYGLLLLICPIVTVLLMLAAEVSYMRAQAVVAPPLPSGARWLVRIQVGIILVSSIMNLILAPWHLRYLSSYQ